jgi:hypothetical protein
MQTAMRLVTKSKCAVTQQLVAAFLQHNAVKVCAAKKQHNTQKALRSLHIGKNCATRSGKRV